MKIYRTVPRRPATHKGLYVAIGVFDGLHIGHQALINSMIKDAQTAGVYSAVLTFLNHPLSVLAPAYCPPRLITPEKQIQLFSQMGVDIVVRIRFDIHYARMKPEEFIKNILYEKLRATKIYCGQDFQFGHGGVGNVDVLRQVGGKLGMETVVVPPVMVNGCVVSSTLIRQLLLAGKVHQVVKLLGRPFELSGRVIKGEGIATSRLGYPTANLKVHRDLITPADGVYAVVAVLNRRRYKAMMNIGTCPTFGKHQRTLEVHLLDFQGNLQGKTLNVLFIARMRKERIFTSEHHLIRQLHQDKQKALAILSARNL
ncbi:bifunctional riboflavin kinase/FAD synthetase [Candidatus Sumerlaeota bacterium]|nr:bifunctional riboflavin kinase/FAD synthetase [Candidatus Sumerlaeota bacterium]